MKVSLFIPCLVDQFYPDVAFSTYRLLSDIGHRVKYPEDQTCCGQPAYNAGNWKSAVPLAEHFLHTFRHAEHIVSPSGSCVSMVRNFYKTLPLSDESRRILADLEHRIFELTEFLVRVCGRTSFGAVFNHRVTYHDSCHLRRELGIIEEPREILRHIEGLEFIEMDGSEDCCGFGGLFSLKYRELAADVARAKIRNASRTGAEYLVSCDAGCIQHIANALRQDDVSILPVHIASILRPERAAP